MMYKMVLFDLDGTIVDSQKGIFESLKFAFNECGIKYDGDLRKFIGPPFVQSIPAFLGVNEVTTKKLIAAYRENYARSGVYETTLYRGIKGLLKTLKERNFTVALATTKPRCFAEIILKRKSIYKLFDFVGGAELDGSIVNKVQVLERVLSQSKIPLSDCVLVGDTLYDSEGAKQVGIDCIGVSYGFGNKDELLKSCRCVTNSVANLQKILLT